MTFSPDISRTVEWRDAVARTEAAGFWASLSARRRRAAFFEGADADGAAAWPALACRASAAVLCNIGPRRAGMLLAVSRPGSHVAEVHAAFTDHASREDADWFVSRALGMVAARTEWRTLVAVVPAAWRHVRALAARHGFTEAARLPELCLLHRRGAHVDGVLLAHDLNHRRQR